MYKINVKIIIFAFKIYKEKKKKLFVKQVNILHILNRMKCKDVNETLKRQMFTKKSKTIYSIFCFFKNNFI